MLKDHFHHGVRASAALALRHTPEFRGKWHVARAVNRHFAPFSQSFCIAWARMRLGHEMLVDLRSYTEFHAYYLGDFDTKEIRGALRLIRPDSTLLDVGANIGFWSIPLASHLKGRGCLHAFEPVSANFRRLAENVRRNNLERTVHLHESGLSDQNRSLQISLREDFANGAETGNAAIIIDSDDLLFKCTEIQVSRLDDIFDSLGVDRIDFIKADIEGHEDRFLAGAANIIRRFRPSLYVEINKPYYQRQGRDAATVFEEWLKANSYDSVFHRKGKWQLDTVRNCNLMDNAFFFPSETVAECLRKVNS
jgi:FkbM family methyltransferase